MNNSSSLISLSNRTVKRKRHRASYKDIYLEQFNFVLAEMSPDKKGLIQQNKMLASSKKLNETNETNALYKARKTTKQLSASNYNNNSNSLRSKGNNNNDIKSIKTKNPVNIMK